MFDIRHAADRGRTNFGWLDSRHTFSFGGYYDPCQTGFSDLLVINDDRVSPGGGFDTHGHRDMEIVTYVLEGALEHRDSTGSGAVVRPGDVQTMTAGTGIAHSEFNHSKSESVHFLQIWIMPDRRGVPPRYRQRFFPEEEKRGRLRLIVSPDGAEGSLDVNQDVRIRAGLFDGAERQEHALDAARFAYLHVARGRLNVNGVALSAGDGARLSGERRLVLDGGEQAEILLFDLRPDELPAAPPSR